MSRKNYRFQDAQLTAARLFDALGPEDGFKVAQGRERWAKTPERKDFWGRVGAAIVLIKIRRAALDPRA